MRNNNQLNKKDISEIIDNNWIDLPVPKKQNENFKKSLREKFYTYYQEASVLYKEIVAIEEPFSYIDDNMIVKGKVDLIAKNSQDQVLLIDFKSRSLQGIEKINVDKQLQIYNHCLESEYNIDKLIAYAFFDNDKLEFPKDDKEITHFLKEVSGKMKEEDFEKRITEFCKQCQFNFHCIKE